MAQQFSFDVSTGVDLQEVDNAVNQAMKEIAQRYDFKGVTATIDFDRSVGTLTLHASDDYKLKALFDVLQTKLIRRKVPVKNLALGDPESAAGDTVRQVITLRQGLEQETAKSIAKTIKDAKLKKVQASIQGDQVRVSAPSKDDLQQAIQLLKGTDWGVELTFGNYR